MYLYWQTVSLCTSRIPTKSNDTFPCRIVNISPAIIPQSLLLLSPDPPSLHSSPPLGASLFPLTVMPLKLVAWTFLKITPRRALLLQQKLSRGNVALPDRPAVFQTSAFRVKLSSSSVVKMLYAMHLCRLPNLTSPSNSFNSLNTEEGYYKEQSES